MFYNKDKISKSALLVRIDEEKGRIKRELKYLDSNEGDPIMKEIFKAKLEEAEHIENIVRFIENYYTWR